ncbi:MAG: translation initiation factor 1 (eIF-1/SUI1), partial [Bradymonadia bacterium]
GSSVEDDAIVVQGDQRDRLATWLTDQGVKLIVKS